MSPNQVSTVLPPKEQNLFKSVVRFYETKQLKKSLKAADTILKRFPDHGETLAMKGLTLNALDKKPEATDLVRRGLRMDIRSHICWHVYGLLYRSEREYHDAARAYLQALRYDKDNQQILRDLALLQIQIRDYDGLEETRRTLLTVRPNQRNNWIGFALSFHLLGNYTTAASVLDTYQDTLKQSNEQEDRYEVSELLLYKNFILEESRDYAAALAHLDEVAPKVVDRLAVRETRARLLSALGRYDESADELRSLLRINPDNRIYHKGLHACAIRAANKSIQPEFNGNSLVDETSVDALPSAAASTADFGIRKVANLELRILGPTPQIQSAEHACIAMDVCNQLTLQFPKSRTAPRLALNLLPSGKHPQFVPRIDAYVRRFLRKGIPSLFSDMKPLYVDASKADAIGILFEGFRDALEDPSRESLPDPLPLPDLDAKLEKIIDNSGNPDPDAEPPCTLLWVLHYLAQHYDRLGKRELALQTIDLAIAHTPTAIECYIVKATILEHCGDLKGAVEVSDEARNMDLADRYLNTKCAKYALRADMVSQAESWVGLFTRDADSGGVQALYDMQCMWFELGAAESHLRNGHSQLAQALKKFTAVDRHFADMVEDQFDFHSYCLRKVTLRAYVSLLRFEDRIRSHPYYARAACGIVECLLRLSELSDREKILITGEHSDIAGFADMTDSERKKAVSKRKKQMHRKSKAQQGSGSGKGSGKPAKGSGKPTANGGDKKSSVSSDGKTASAGNASDSKGKSNPGWMEQDASGAERLKELFKRATGKDAILHEASKIVKELQLHLPGQMQTQVLSFELAIKKGKHLQALRAVKRAQRIDRDHPDALLLSIKLAQKQSEETWRSACSDVVKRVYEREGQILGGITTMDYISSYMRRNAGYAERCVGAARCLLWMAKAGVSGAGSVEEACKEICDAVEKTEYEGTGDNTLSAFFYQNLILCLKREGLKKELVSSITEICRSKYPRATCF